MFAFIQNVVKDQPWQGMTCCRLAMGDLNLIPHHHTVHRTQVRDY